MSSEPSQENIISGHNHSFDTGIASVLGLMPAVVFNHIVYWLRLNASKKGCELIEGKVWMYETQAEISNGMGYLSEDDVKRSVKKLIDSGLIEVGNFNKNPFDRTNWYTVCDQNIISKGLRNSKTTYEEANLPDRGLKKCLREGTGACSEGARLPTREGSTAGCINTVQEEHIHKEKQDIVCSLAPVGASQLEKNRTEFCEKTHPDGHKMKISLQGLISESMLFKKNFSLNEIHEAWEALISCTQKVRDPLKYIEGVIVKIRNSKSYNNITQKEQEKKCQINIQKNKSEKNNYCSLGLDMWGRPLVKSNSPNPIAKN